MIKSLPGLQLIDRRRAADLFVISISFLSTCFLSTGFYENNLPLRAVLGVFVVACHFGILLPVVKSERHWQNVSAYDAIQIAQAIVGSTLASVMVSYIVAPESGLSRWLCLNAIITISGLCAIRLARRMQFEKQNLRANKLVGRRTFIVGTGSSGRALAFRFANDASLGVCLIGFIDTDPAQVGARVSGLKVLGTLANLDPLIKNCLVQDLIIAEPKLGTEPLKEILKIAQNHGIKPKILNDDSITGTSNERKGVLREVELHDLLPRPAVEVDLKAIEKSIAGRTILISGGGGSIGSELVRQIMSFKPKKILILDQSEYNLYAIESELKKLASQIPVFPILSDLKERAILNHVFTEHVPDFIFHAAAYKHVHLVETNANAAIINNLVSTKTLLDCAIQHRVQNFVLISSDKAVNPLGVMGATKRACELLVTQAAEESGYRYCSVRFGNVLGSSGSFIPLLKQQIAQGGPVTITHPDMERYFMLIPEAVSLVLKAASISNPGDISILKMGEPIKIVDLAKTLIMLMGKSEQSTPIVFTGIRPGEKLKEELYLSGDELMTEYSNIVILPRGAQLHSGLRTASLTAKITVRQMVENIILFAQRSDDSAARLLKSLVAFNDTEFFEIEREVNHEGVKHAYSRTA